MRCWILSVCLILPASIAAAADTPLGPAAYLAILADSKLHYNVRTEPSKTPIEIQTCPGRGESMRVVRSGAEKKIVPWPLNLEVVKLLSEGEKLFDADKFDEAAAKYQAALAKDPEFAVAYLFYGDTLLMGANNPAAALAQYQKAIALDPTLPRPHFFASTAYLKLGRPADAREEVVRALAFYPTYESIWKIARQNPEVWGAKPVNRHPFEPPQGYLGVKGPNGIDIFAGENGEWMGYAICKAVWANEEKFGRTRSEGRWSLEEEHACVVNQLTSVLNATQAKLAKQGTPVKERDVIAALPPLEAHLFDAANAGLLDGYILFEIIGRHCPIALSVMSDGAKQQVEAYLRKYVIVAAE